MYNFPDSPTVGQVFGAYTWDGEKWTQPSVSFYVAKAGDTMTGPLVLPGPPSATLQAATKGYVDGAVPAPATVAPPVDGTAAVGTSLLYARQDHVHPSNAPAPATVAPPMDGAAAVGTSALYARQDHVHPTDTSRAPIDSPTFTGTPAAPTAAPGTSNTQLATTAFVAAAASGAAGVWTLIADVTASNSADLHIANIPQTYKWYVLALINLVPAAGSTSAFLRFSTNNGASYDAGSNYLWANVGTVFSGGAPSGLGAAGSTADTGFKLSGGVAAIDTTVSRGGVSGMIRLFNLGLGTLGKQITFETFSALTTNTAAVMTGSGMYTPVTAVNALQVLFSTGNIAQGEMKLYGIN